MSELHRRTASSSPTLLDILGELSDIDRRLETPGAFVSGQRDALVSRRRSLQARFEGLQSRPDYLTQVADYTSALGDPGLGLPA